MRASFDEEGRVRWNRMRDDLKVIIEMYNSSYKDFHLENIKIFNL